MNASRVTKTAVVLLGASAVISLFALVAGQSPLAVVWTLLVYSTSGIGFSEVLVHAIPLTLLGLGTAVALKAGLFNIGGDGQLTCGALLAVAVSPMLSGLGGIGLLLFLALGCVGGGLLGGLVGALRAQFGASEIIVTIMLNYVCAQLASFAVRGPLQEPMHVFPRSFAIPSDCILPILIEGTRLHAGAVIAVAAAVVMAIIMYRTSLGFRIAVLGANSGAALYAGFRAKALTIGTMAMSGALAGLAGAVQIAGIHHKIEDNFADGFGLAGIAVALIARLNPFAVPFAAVLFGVFFAGSGSLQRQLGVPFPLVYIIEATAIFAVVLLPGAYRRRTAHV